MYKIICCESRDKKNLMFFDSQNRKMLSLKGCELVKKCMEQLKDFDICQQMIAL